MKKWYWLIILIIGVVVRIFPVFFGNTFSFGDNVSLQVPVKMYSAYWLRQGIIPWWNPTIFAGIPWAEDISQFVFYPTQLFFLLFDPSHALNITIASHLFFTGIGMYFVAKNILPNSRQAALAMIMWTFSPQLTYSINNIVTLQSIAWFPWVVLGSLNLTKKKWGRIIFGLLILAQFMAGYPQHVLYSIMTTVLLDVCLTIKHKNFQMRAWMLNWMKSGLIVLGITALAWLPFVRVLSESTRSIQNSTQAMVGSLNPMMLPKIILPYLFDLPSAGFRWGPAFAGFPHALFYFGLPGLLGLGIFLKRNRYWLIVFGGLFLFSLGSYIPGFHSVFELLPMLKFARYPSMAMIPITFFASLLIPQQIFLLGKLQLTIIASKILPIVMLFCISLLIVLWPAQQFSLLWSKTNVILGNVLSQSHFHTLEKDHKIFQVILADFSLVLLFSWLVLLALRSKRYFLVVVLITLDLIVHTQGVLFFGPKNIFPTWEKIRENNQLSSQFQTLSRKITNNTNQPYIDFNSYWEEISLKKPFSKSTQNLSGTLQINRLNNLISSKTPNWNMPFNIPIINGYATLLPKDFASIWQTSKEPRINFIDYIDLKNPLLKEWSVDTLIVDNQFDPGKQFSNYPLMNGLDSISTYHLDALLRIRYANDSDIEFSSFQETPNTIKFEFNNLRNQQSVIIADRYDKNWQARINGVPTAIQNYQGMRLLGIHSGNNLVELKYIPKNMCLGMLASIATLATCIAIQIIKPKLSSKRQ